MAGPAGGEAPLIFRYRRFWHGPVWSI